MSAFDGVEPLHTYTRAQAILDGVLVPVTDLVPDEPEFARQAGYNCHVALTSALAAVVTPTDREADEEAQSIKGRLWDVLCMARVYKRGVTDSGGEWRFPCIFVLAGEGRGQFVNRKARKTLHLWASLHGDDDGKPCVTIGFPEDR